MSSEERPGVARVEPVRDDDHLGVPVGAVDEPVIGVGGRQVRRRRVVGLPDRLRDEVERQPRHRGSRHAVAGWSTETQRRSSASWITVGPDAGERRPERRLEPGIGVDANPARAARPGGRREVDRPEVRAGRGRAPLASPGGHRIIPYCSLSNTIAMTCAPSRTAVSSSAIVMPDAAVAAAARRRGRSRWTSAAAMRRREAVAHGARRGPEERARPPEAEAARRPAAEVAGIGGQDRVVGAAARRRSAMIRPGWTPGPVPRRGVDLGRGLPRRPVGAVVARRVRRTGAASRTAPSGAPRPPGGRRARRSGSPARARAHQPAAPSRGSRSTWIQRWPRAGIA